MEIDINEPNFSILKLNSDHLFYQIFTHKNNKKSDLKIPTTIICNDGQVINWLFNSDKERNHPILRKHKENISNVKIIKNICYLLGYGQYIKQFSLVEQIKDAIESNIKQSKINANSSVLIHYKNTKDYKNIKLLDFIKALTDRSYSQNKCPNSWKLLQDKSYINSKYDQIYYVQAIKPSQLLNLRFNYLKRLTSLEQDSKFINQEQIFKLLGSNQSITKIQQQSLTHRFLSTTVKVIDFFQHNYKLSIKSIIIKCSLNKNRQCIFLGVVSLHIKIPDRYLKSQEIGNKQEIDFEQYIKIADRLKQLPQLKQPKKKKLISQKTLNQTNACSGDFCNINFQDEFQNKKFRSNPILSQINNNVISGTRKNLPKILSKLKEINLIPQNQSVDPKKQVDPELNQEIQKNSLERVCKKCHFIYNTISKFYQFDNSGTISPFSKGLNPQNKKFTTLLQGVPSKKQIFNIKKQYVTGTIERSNAEKKPSEKNFLFHNIQNLNKFKFNNKMSNNNTITNSSEQTQRRLQDKKNAEPIKVLPFKEEFQKQLPKPVNKISGFQKSNRAKSVAILPKIPPKNVNPPPKKDIQIQKQPILRKTLGAKLFQNKATIKKQYNLETAIKPLLSNYIPIAAQSIPQLKQKYRNFYLNYKQKQQQIQYFTSIYQSSGQVRNIYEFENNSPIKQSVIKYSGVINVPKITLQKLSEQTGYPQIVMKNNFLVDTIVCDERTTLVYCVLTSQMFQNDPDPQMGYENMIICHDMFDGFLEYLQIAKSILQNSQNKRIIMYNQPGQSHTIFDRFVNYDSLYQIELLDKVLFRLNYLEILDFQEDTFKFCGIGYGGYLTQLFLINHHLYFKNIKRILLINSYSILTKPQTALLESLNQIYSQNQNSSEEYPYVAYSTMLNSQTKQDFQSKMLLNPITVQGRQTIIKNILSNNINIGQKFEEVPIRTTILHGEKNSFVKLQDIQSFLFYKKNPTKQIPGRQILLLQKSGHDMKSDRLEELISQLAQFLIS